LTARNYKEQHGRLPRTKSTLSDYSFYLYVDSETYLSAGVHGCICTLI